MDVFPKFIIEDDREESLCLVIAKCTFHKQLAHDVTRVRGGGWWSLDHENSIFTLYGESHDFGRADIEDIKSCIDRKKVFSAGLVRNLSDKYTFRWRDEVGDLIEL